MNGLNILVIDDDLGDFKAGLQQALRGHMLHLAYSGREGLAKLEQGLPVDLVLLDIKMPADFAEVEGREGLEVLKKVKEKRPSLPVIMLTVLTEVDLVVEAIQGGAFHYITKPIDRDKLREAVLRATENVKMRRSRDAVLRVQASPQKKRREFCGMVGDHPLMQQLFSQIERAAQFSDMNVVILGETGAGKDLVARAVHECSDRKERPFVATNCAAMPETMMEAELFGHKKGAFTGAEADRKGLFAQADGGTLFLDEIGEMSAALQAKVLRAIENQVITPIGGEPQRVDVRIICATHRDLVEAKDRGEFREDLFYRIWDIPLAIPPLRERREDIPRLVHHFLQECEKTNNLHCGIEPAAVRALTEYEWSGNVRELASVLRRLVVFSQDGMLSEHQVRQMLGTGVMPAMPIPEEAQDKTETIEEPAEIPAATQTGHADMPSIDADRDEYPVVNDMNEYGRIHGELKLRGVIERALEKTGSAKKAMALLSIPETNYDAFRKRLQRLDIRVSDYR